MRRTLVAACAAALLVGSAVIATAQGPGGGGGRQGGMGMRGGFGGGGLRMLQIKEVQAELKMTEPQIAKLEGKQQEVQQAMTELRNSMPQPQPGEQPDRAQMQKMMTKMREIQTKAVTDVLDSTQMKRYKQLELQQMGVQALQLPEVKTALAITDEQTKQAQSVQQAQMAEMRNLMPQGGFQNMSDEDRTAFQKKMQEFRKTTETKVLAVLTADQQKKFKDMQGTPFKFPQNGFGMGGGRRGGAGGPGGAGGGTPPPPA